MFKYLIIDKFQNSLEFLKTFPQFEFRIFTSFVLKLKITHIVSLPTLILLFLKSHTEFSSLTYSLMYTHKSRFQKAHQTHSLVLTFTQMTDDIFQGPSVPALPLLSLCLHFLSFALLYSLLTLSTHSSFCKLALVFVFKSACGFTKHTCTQTHTPVQGAS